MTMTIQNELLRSMQLHRNTTAIEQGDTTVSYQTLLDKANAVTAFLLQQNLEKETMVGVYLEDRVAAIVAIIGIMNARCVFVPLDTALPQSRLHTICAELDLQHVITTQQAPQQAFLHASLAHCYSFDDIAAQTVADQVIDYPAFDEQDSLYVYFTSGSTGKPKGILGVNRSVAQFIHWEISEFGITNECRCSQLISPYFDAFLRDLFVPLLAGGTICVPPADDHFFTYEKMVSWLDRSGITLIHCVPSVFSVINQPGVSNNNFASLQHILLSGEKIVPSDLANWYAVFGNRIQLVNLYGATETTMIRSFYRIQPEDVNQVRIPIGAAISGTELLILKEDHKPCGTLMPGELYIVSDYLTKGYYNQPALNKEKFVTIQVAGKGEVTAYKTGDKARKLASGVIDLLGRDDRQIKLNGIRIELDEVEQLLASYSGVKNAVVVVKEEGGNRSLVAFVIPAEAGAANISTAVLTYAKQHLPTYMLPAAVIAMEQYPLLSNGKINHKELSNYTTVEEVKPASTATEEKLMRIWKEILGDRTISVTNSFHSQGGNSLGIMKLIARIYKEFHVRIQLNDLFNNLTIEKQGVLIDASLQDDAMALAKAPVKPAYHLSAAQESVYYNYALNKQQTAFNLPVAWEIKGAYNLANLTAAFQQLLDRHETLRTTFKVEDGKLLQVVADEVTATIEEIVSYETDAATAILDFVRPFDLAELPLIRCGVITLPVDRKILVMDIHHIVCDGISQVNLYADFLKLYNQEKLSPLPIQYKDYAEWEYNFRLTSQYLSLREFWLKEFEDNVPSLSLPTRCQEENSPIAEGANLHFSVDKAVYQPLADALSKDNITLFSGLFGVFHLFLAQLSGQDDIVIGINTAGRMQQELEALVGMFAKTLPVRNKLHLENSYRQFIQQVHQKLVSATSKQLYDLSDIVSELKKSKDAPVHRLFDVMLVFQNFAPEIVATQGVEFVHQEFENPTAKYPITLFASESSDALHFRFEYATNYFNTEDVQVMQEQFVSLLTFVSANLDASIADYASEPAELALVAVEDSVEFNF